MPEKFPDWAPKDLCELYIRNDFNHEQERDLAYSLITYNGMRNVWPQLERRRSNLTIGAQNIDIGYLLLIFVERSLDDAQVQLERIEDLPLYKEISDTGKRFATLIKNHELNPSLTRLDKHLVDSPDWIGMLDLIAEDDKSLAEAVLYIVKCSDNNIKIIENNKYLLPYRNIKNAQRVAFIRALSNYFLSNFGQKMYRTLATITRATLMDEGVDEGIVGDALKTPSVKFDVEK